MATYGITRPQWVKTGLHYTCLVGAKPLSEPMMVRLPPHIWIIRTDWVKEKKLCSHNWSINFILSAKMLIEAPFYWIFQCIMLTVKGLFMQLARHFFHVLMVQLHLSLRSSFSLHHHVSSQLTNARILQWPHNKKIGLWWVTKNLVDDKSTLVLVIASCHNATSHYQR